MTAMSSNVSEMDRDKNGQTSSLFRDVAKVLNYCNFYHTSAQQKPARVVQWSNDLCTMCSRAWHVQWPQSGVQSEPRPGKARPPTKKWLFEKI